jgi:hypothetical protein
MHTLLIERENILDIVLDGALTKPEILALWQHLNSYQHLNGALVRVPSGWWEITGNDVHDLAQRAGQLPPIRWALFAEDAVSFGMFRMFSTLAENKGLFRVFLEEEAARAWVAYPRG